MARVPYSSNHLRRLEAQGDFPSRVRIGANRVAWLRDEVEQWLTERMEGR
ncbi:helix-turn-helix transcriptional regulator [Yoonia vestfoldensis]|nr:AlpA family phage regulatory protein [Yoonia vestfoldensis]